MAGYCPATACRLTGKTVQLTLMSKNSKKKSAGTTEDKGSAAMDWRPWVIRAVLLSVLVFGFVAWRLQPVVGNSAYLWALLLAGVIIAWLGVSYYLLNR